MHDLLMWIGGGMIFSGVTIMIYSAKDLYRAVKFDE